VSTETEDKLSIFKLFYMNKRKNLTKAALGREKPFFVQEINDDLKIYIVKQSDFDDSSKTGMDSINCLVLEYYETDREIIYSIKEPDTYITLKRGTLAGMLFTD
jgi:hypothetical protein